MSDPVTTKKREVPGDVAIPSGPAREDRSKQGWPGTSDNPFVPKEYYNWVPERFRPTFVGGPASINLSIEQYERIKARFQKDFTLQTYINMSLQPHILLVVGPSADSPVHVKVPAFGVVRADPETIDPIMTGDGFDYPQFFPIGAEGDCNGQHGFTINGQLYTSCKNYNCPRHPSSGLVHSIHHALHFVCSLGQGSRDPINPNVARSYLEEDVVQKMLFKYNTYDPRPEVMAFGQLRMRTLAERKARNDALRSQASR
jgi:hypothetical protein